jgi:hypothetical protein
VKPLLLDLFCGAGGCAMGYHRAGFDVVGVDIVDQPRYPFTFIKADALEHLRTSDLSLVAAIHASPPCQAFSLATLYHPATAAKHPNLIDETRRLLDASGLPYVIENVERSPLRRDLVLCGEMFNLRVHRHRVFELGRWFAMQPHHQPHRLEGAVHNCDVRDGVARLVAGNYSNHPDASDAMDIDWMTRKELAQAIPPAYTSYVGAALMQHLRSAAA